VTKKFSAFIFCLFIFVASVFSQTDSLTASVDSTVQLMDSAAVQSFSNTVNYQSFLKNGNQKVQNDIQQLHSTRRNGYVFVLLMLMLAALTYVKVAFGKDLEEMLQSIVNRNLAQQIFRTQSGEISFADILLHTNFIVVMSLYARFFLMKYFHVSSLESFSSVLFLIFLFTFFYVAKIASLLFIGKIFELEYACDEYIFNFTTITKTLGLTLLPALFVFYTAPVKYFNFIFIITILFFVAFVLVFIWRALSTAYKLLYRSVYHFFIYVCVVEMSITFLFFKLLTKTII